ncbi:hypothetical protein PNF55_001310 [Cronobacter sakazakii]|uniref:hypothetical protein n=1 Tax=Cronobacter sakazakii TaxID=28141 RepID=UPI000B3D8AD4|nr:hypothetical protein [Cronobacter sakazakii]EGT4949774.1 hypothetical protein [Cronobacter sakazakii]EKK3987988.1 hypothetical protein [Cronobacter sakazakii]EKK3995784.1 hypothetical protein [Cronobacter sakazakii]EKK4067518.1 hypothetical protein [Cronobacter sakazakii]ELY2475626.1 hypothetical protein [Cronobacter sakazakii]
MHIENKELAKAGHELAKCLDSNTPLIDIAKMIVRVADKLDVTTAALREKTKQCDALAVRAQITDRIFDNLSADEAEQACGWINTWIEYQMSKGGAA